MANTNSAQSAGVPAAKGADRRQQRREEILDRAIVLFARHGFNELDLQVLADDLQIGKGTLYRHFGSKQELFLAATDNLMHQLFQSVVNRTANLTDPLDQIRAGILGYLEFFEQHPEAIEIFVQERAQFRDRPRPTYFVHRDANIDRWHNMYRVLQAEGRVRPLPPESITDFVGSFLYGTIFVQYFSAQRRPAAELAEEMFDILLHGILAPKPTSPDSQIPGPTHTKTEAHPPQNHKE